MHSVIGYKLKVTVTVTLTLTARRRQQYICFADTKMSRLCKSLKVSHILRFLSVHLSVNDFKTKNDIVQQQ